MLSYSPMPRRKKKAHELTTDEAMRKMFPLKARKTAKAEAEKARKSTEKNSTKK
jgi:hypothetical protein